jgi:Tfp pilus assembly protein PilW
MKTPLSRGALAFTLIESLIAASVGLLVLGAVLSAAIAMQRCFIAAEDFAVAKTDQARLSDYLALDLRRALTVTPGTDGSTIMTVQIPDYYDAAGQPSTPTITNYVANYGDPARPVSIAYRKIGSSIYRQENARTPREIAANVEDFQLSVQDLGKVVKTQVTFAPRFQRIATVEARTATTVFNTTLLRNKRKDL